MNKEIFAVLALVSGLLGFNLIAVAQTMAYMQVRKFTEVAPETFAIGGPYKTITLILGLLAIVLCFFYMKSESNSARLFNGLGGILGLVCAVLSLFPVYLWLL